MYSPLVDCMESHMDVIIDNIALFETKLYLKLKIIELELLFPGSIYYKSFSFNTSSIGTK
jgi:hypothetical protein